MRRKEGTIYRKDGQDFYIRFKNIQPEEVPEYGSAIIIENSVIKKFNNEDKVTEKIKRIPLEIDADKIKFVLNVNRITDRKNLEVLAHSAEEEFDEIIKEGMDVWAKPRGFIKKIQGPIIEIEFSVPEKEYNELPNIYDVLTLKKHNVSRKGEEKANDKKKEEDDYIYLEVQAHLGDGRIRAIALDSTDGLGKDDKVIDTGGPIRVPVGITGRLFNVIGKAIDGSNEPLIARHKNGNGHPTEMIATSHRVIKEKIIKEPPQYKDLDPKRRIMQTYIKVVDLIAPFPRGGKIGFFGGAGVGKTVFLKELINTLIVKQNAFAIFSGIGERTREGSEDWEDFNKEENKHLLENLLFVFGQMNETSGIRFRAGQTAITMAEYFRDKEHKSVIVFIDNIFRYIQAGSEVSTLLGRMPSAVGYQPTLEMELGDIEERISSVTYKDSDGQLKNASITAIQAVYVPADDLTDPAPSAIFAHLDANLVLKREIAELKIYPAVDPLESTSRMLAETEKDTYAKDFIKELRNDKNPTTVKDIEDAIATYTEELLEKLLHSHSKISKKIKEILEKYKGLESTINLLGVEELPPEDKIIYERAIRIKKFLSQPFVVSEQFSGIDGVQVPIWDTLFGFLCLAVDDIEDIKRTKSEDDFWNKGKIDDVEGYGETLKDKNKKQEKIKELINKI